MDNYKSKMIKYYNEENKLMQYPSKRPMRIIALARIADRLEIGKNIQKKK